MNKENTTGPVPGSLSAAPPSIKRKRARLQERRRPALYPLPSHSGRGVTVRESRTHLERAHSSRANVRTENAKSSKR